jgi:hypothetical protein
VDVIKQVQSDTRQEEMGEKGKKRGERAETNLTLFQFCVEVLAYLFGQFNVGVARDKFDLLHVWDNESGKEKKREIRGTRPRAYTQDIGEVKGRVMGVMGECDSI